MRHDVSPVKHPTGGKFCELGGGKSRHFANQSRILSVSYTHLTLPTN